MQIKVAEFSDIAEILELHYRYQVDSISDADKRDGFVTTPFNKSQLETLIKNEAGLFIARTDGILVAYVMAASWDFWSQWPIFSHMIQGLHEIEFLGQKLSKENSYQYGPVCINKSSRGSGALERIFDFAREKMTKRYPILVTFINKANQRSYEAHTRKLHLQVMREFEYCGNHYYELVYDTSKSVESGSRRSLTPSVVG